MSDKHVVFSLAALFIIAVLIFFYFYFPTGEERRIDGEIDSEERVTTVIPVEYQYVGGVHTYTGVVQTPTPCYQISGEVLVKESYPEQVDIKLETKDTGEICIQVIAEKRFKVSFNASKNPIVRAYLNGSPVLFEVAKI